MRTPQLITTSCVLPLLCLGPISCGGSSPDQSDATTSTEAGASATSTSESGTETTTGDGDPTGDGDGDPTGDGDGDPVGDGDGDGDGDPSGDGDGDGDGGCHHNIVLMGYWPPTNEMLRPFSQNLEQNPDGWVGHNWNGHGYDVYAFFPEFPPDGDPSNDEIGEPGAVGSVDSDLQVDYQDTSLDFWALVDEYEPALLITTSRGSNIGWELEAVEGGHGDGGDDPAFDWYPDFYGDDIRPSQQTIDPRSWAGISTYRDGVQLPSQLPLDEILAATDALGLTNVEIDQTTSGNFLSGFLGLHGLLYNARSPHNLAAGHIHVGFGLPTQDASQLIEATLEAVIQAHPLACDPDA